MIGAHTIVDWCRGQAVIAISSGEVEYYAAVGVARSLLHIRSLLSDWGIEMKLVVCLKTDSTAAKGFASRRGLSKLMIAI